MSNEFITCGNCKSLIRAAEFLRGSFQVKYGYDSMQQNFISNGKFLFDQIIYQNRYRISEMNLLSNICQL